MAFVLSCFAGFRSVATCYKYHTYKTEQGENIKWLLHLQISLNEIVLSKCNKEIGKTIKNNI